MATPQVRKDRSLLNCRRLNYVEAAHVNAASTILQLYGLQRATNLLKAAKIPDKVIIRVLQSDALIRSRQSVSPTLDWPTR